MAAPNLPTLVPTGYITYSGTAPTTTTVDNIDNTVASPDGLFLVLGANSTGSVFYDFTNTPSDFVGISSLNYNIRYKLEGNTNDTESLFIRIFKSDRTTALTDEATIEIATTSVGIKNKGSTALTVNATGLAASKADWDAAVIAIRSTHSGNMGNDGSVWSIDEVELTGTYKYKIYGASTINTSSSISATISKRVRISSTISTSSSINALLISKCRIFSTISPYHGVDYSSTWDTKSSDSCWFVISSLDGKYVISGNQVGGYVKFSNDYGATFNNLPQGGWWYDGCISDDGQVICLHANAFNTYISMDYGSSWNIYTNGNTSNKGKICGSADGSIVYVLSTTYNTVYKSTNYGQTFTALSLTTTCTYVDCSSDGQIVYVVRNGALKKSVNGGTDWSDISGSFGSVITNTDGSLVFNFNGTLQKSSDGGSSWKTVASGMGSGMFIHKQRDCKYLFIAVNNGTDSPAISGDYGETWQRVNITASTYLNGSTVSNDGKYAYITRRTSGSYLKRAVGVMYITATLTNKVNEGAIFSTISTTTTQSATLIGKGQIISTINGATTQTGNLNGKGVISSAIATSSSINVTGRARVNITSTINDNTSQTAVLSAKGILQSTINEATTLSVILTGNGELSSNINCESSVSASIVGIRTIPISSAISEGTTHSAELIGLGELDSTINTSSSINATLTGEIANELESSINTSSLLQGTVQAKGKLESNINILSNIYINLSGRGSIIGTSSPWYGVGKSSSWVSKSTDSCWFVVSSYGGKYVVSGKQNGGYAKFSNDFGENFSNVSENYQYWFDGCISDDGQYICLHSNATYTFVSENYGISWTRYNNPITSNKGKICGSANGSIVYVLSTYYPRNIHKSTDYGKTFSIIYQLPSGQSASYIDCSSDGQIIYVATNVGLKKSINGGTSWSDIAGSYGSIITNTDGSLVLNFNGTLQRSTNGGTNWATIGLGFGSGMVINHPRDCKWIIVAVNDGVNAPAISNDYGITWQRLDITPSTNLIGSAISGNGKYAYLTQRTTGAFLKRATEPIDISALLKGRGNFNSSQTTSSTVTGILIAKVFIVSTIDCSTSLVATLKAKADLYCTINTSSVIDSALLAKGELASSINTASSIDATLGYIAEHDLVATISEGSQVLGTLKGKGGLISTIVTQSTVAGIILSEGGMIANINEGSQIISALHGNGRLVGTSDSLSSVQGSLIGKCFASVTISTSTGILATLQGIGNVGSNVSTFSTVEGTLKGLGELQLTISTTSTVVGNLAQHQEISPITALIGCESVTSGTLTGRGGMSVDIGEVIVISAILLGHGRLESGIGTRSDVEGSMFAIGLPYEIFRAYSIITIIFQMYSTIVLNLKASSKVEHNIIQESNLSINFDDESIITPNINQKSKLF